MMTATQKIGVIGLGLMGRAMAARLIQAGFSVVGYDVSAEAMERAARLGVETVPDATVVARRCTCMLLSLFSSENRKELFWGAQALAQALSPGAAVLDTTTGSPEDLEEDARRLAENGVTLVDVCLSGSSQVMEEGRAIALVGGAAMDARCEAVLQAISMAQYYFDAPGQGCRVKLIVNLVFGLHRLVLAEALGFARSAGFDPATILEILKAGETYSVAMDTKGPKMLAGVYEPAVARLGQHAKDVALILDYARRVSAKVPVTETHARLIDALVADGFGGLDNAAIFKAYGE